MCRREASRGWYRKTKSSCAQTHLKPQEGLVMYVKIVIEYFDKIVMKGRRRVFKKHSLHAENSSLCFIEAVHQWKWMMPHWHTTSAWAEIHFFTKQYTLYYPKGIKNIILYVLYSIYINVFIIDVRTKNSFDRFSVERYRCAFIRIRVFLV